MGSPSFGRQRRAGAHGRGRQPFAAHEAALRWGVLPRDQGLHGGLEHELPVDPVAHVWPNVIARRPELGPVESTISHSPVEPAALDAMTPMRNDLRRCDGRKKDIKELRKSNAPLQSS